MTVAIIFTAWTSMLVNDLPSASHSDASYGAGTVPCCLPGVKVCGKVRVQLHVGGLAGRVTGGGLREVSRSPFFCAPPDWRR